MNAKISKLKTEHVKIKAKLTKELEKEQQERERREAIKFPVKDEVLLKLDLKDKPLKSIPPALMYVNEMFRDNVGNDAMVVWDFLNVFRYAEINKFVCLYCCHLELI